MQCCCRTCGAAARVSTLVVRLEALGNSGLLFLVGKRCPSIKRIWIQGTWVLDMACNNVVIALGLALRPFWSGQRPVEDGVLWVRKPDFRRLLRWSMTILVSNEQFVAGRFRPKGAEYNMCCRPWWLNAILQICLPTELSEIPC
jgi:hypothetical protein